MPILTVKQAAVAVGKNSQTLYRHSKNGVLSLVLMEDGTKGVDTSELMRVYGALKRPAPEPAAPPKAAIPSELRQNVELELQKQKHLNQLLLARLMATQEALKVANAALEEHRQEKSRLFNIVEIQTRLIEHKRDKESS